MTVECVLESCLSADRVSAERLDLPCQVADADLWFAEDPRVTRVGRWLRRLSLDELPQLLNVLGGSMALVGPRPHALAHDRSFERRIAQYARRHNVRPGITGWAQINYPYGASIEDARQKLEYDLYYAKNYSPFLDLLILLQTLRVVLWPSGAR